MMTLTHREWRAEGGGTCGKEGVWGRGRSLFYFFLRWSVLLLQIIVEELMAWKLDLSLFTYKQQTVNYMTFMAHDEKSGAPH